MTTKSISLVRIGILLLIAMGAASLVVSSLQPPAGRRKVLCLYNLQQLYKLGTVYAAQHKGQWPDVQDGNDWVSFTKTTPALIEPESLEILSCPVRDEPSGQCDYRGPKVPWSRLQPGDPLAAERPGNHGPGEPVNVLFKDGSVMEVDLDDPRWKRWEELLGP